MIPTVSNSNRARDAINATKVLSALSLSCLRIDATFAFNSDFTFRITVFDKDADNCTFNFYPHNDEKEFYDWFEKIIDALETNDFLVVRELSEV